MAGTNADLFQQDVGADNPIIYVTRDFSRELHKVLQDMKGYACCGITVQLIYKSSEDHL